MGKNKQISFGTQALDRRVHVPPHANRAARRIAINFGIPLTTAGTIAELAGIGFGRD